MLLSLKSMRSSSDGATANFELLGGGAEDDRSGVERSLAASFVRVDRAEKPTIPSSGGVGEGIRSVALFPSFFSTFFAHLGRDDQLGEGDFDFRSDLGAGGLCFGFSPE